jgi:PKD repeat protein
MKNIALAGLFISALFPLAAHAATAAELQAQIVDLLGRITNLQQQLGTSGGSTTGVGGTAATSVPAGVAQCPHVSRVLKRGATGVDVNRLQQFLALDPAVYPEAQVSGYYGALTEAAVKRFQCKNKLVCDGTPDSTGYGVTGPRTAALMALQCSAGGGASSNVGGFIRVTPISGNAPLNVTIEATVNTTKSCSGATYEVDYGDNAPKTVINVPANNCNEMRQVLAHTYSSNGTYTVTLRSGTQQTNATVTVGGGTSGTVPAGTVDSLSGSPTSGTAPLSVTLRGTINATGACSINSYVLDFGDGQTAPLVPSGCTPSLFTATHIYSRAGTFNAKLIRDAGNVTMANVTVTVSGGTSGGGSGSTDYGSFFSVSPGSGGDVYAVVADFEIPSSCTAYQLNWGDSSSLVTQSQGTCSNGTVAKQFQHTYQSAGDYTVTLKRGSNLSETHTAGITISD